MGQCEPNTAEEHCTRSIENARGAYDGANAVARVPAIAVARVPANAVARVPAIVAARGQLITL